MPIWRGWNWHVPSEPSLQLEALHPRQCRDAECWQHLPLSSVAANTQLMTVQSDASTPSFTSWHSTHHGAAIQADFAWLNPIKKWGIVGTQFLVGGYLVAPPYARFISQAACSRELRIDRTTVAQCLHGAVQPTTVRLLKKGCVIWTLQYKFTDPTSGLH